METPYPAPAGPPEAIPGVSKGSDSFEQLRKLMMYRQMFGLGDLSMGGAGGAPSGFTGGMASGAGNSFNQFMNLMSLMKGQGQ